ncbi:diguanylate cyclase [Lactiplantibacillus garii]|uniref:Diguanylate cyclase n=1 Tax=Lactiplantibacillus garii TaxID=2306423 RepID=A0A3R8QT96_9LACO|nr:GGDEF domain-containing protein [Lactiplantibacillus garii]RRK11642.1 diguanylate cyclase [Lactiplantibacillus garii]
MSWSLWLIPPFLTSIFFFLGVITLYWSVYTWVTTKLEARQKNTTDLKKIQTIVGITCAVISIFGLQLIVRASSLSWAFTSFNLLILIFIAYFLQIWIPYWLVTLAGIGFMVLNGNVDQPLSWGYTVIFAAFYIISYFQSVAMAPHPFLRYFRTAIIFGGLLWATVRLRFDLSWATFAEEFFSYLLLAVMMYGYFRIQDRNQRIKDRLFQAANWDALTHVKNYAAYDREIAYQFQHCAKHHQPLSMIMFDIDHFKQTNDTYGHLAGDQVLEKVAAAVATVLKSYGERTNLYRTGGEEFNVIMPNLNTAVAGKAAKEILDTVAQLPIVYDGTTLHVTVSIGASEVIMKDHNPLDFYRRVGANKLPLTRPLRSRTGRIPSRRPPSRRVPAKL